jgi:hypothetical protein
MGDYFASLPGHPVSKAPRIFHILFAQNVSTLNSSGAFVIIAKKIYITIRLCKCYH